MPFNLFHASRATRYWAAFLTLGLLIQVDGRAQTAAPTATNQPAAQPPSTDPILTLKPDHLDGVYALNEPAVWTVDVKSGDRSGLGALTYAVKRDGGDDIATGTINLAAGPATITATRPEPGALLAIVSVPNGTRHPRLWTGGAVFAPDKIGPAAPAPADFDAFWKAKLQDLAAVPVNPTVVQATDDVPYNDGIPYYKVTLDNIWHTQVQGQLAHPVKKGKYPALIIFQAAGVGPLQKGMVVQPAKRGYLVLNIEAHDMPIDETPAFYNNLKATSLKDYTSIGVDDRETYYFLRMVLGCVRAAEYLTSRPDWDGKTLIVSGVSQGGFQSFATAALFPKVTALVTGSPGGVDAYAVLANPPRPVAWPACFFPPRPEDADGAKARATLGYFDAIYFAARVHCPALVCVGLVDETVRPASDMAAYNAIPGTDKELILMPFFDHSLACSQLPYWHRRDDWTAAAKAGQPLPPSSFPAATPEETLIPFAPAKPAPVAAQ
jgi:cephalosporin-C deacetylase